MASPIAIAISTDGKVSSGALAWRYRDRVELTVIVKATFAIADGSVAAHRGPSEIVAEERTFDANPTRSVEWASDLVPYRARCDVTFVGHAYAPAGRPQPASSVRIGLARDGRTIVDKVLHVFGNRGGDPQTREPFTKMPIVYERAVGGPGEQNPVGTETPNIVDPRDARVAAGYAPISRFWPSRKRLIAKIDKRALDAPVMAIPDDMPWDYWQSAPPDQQTEMLRGGEWLVLDGLHPSMARTSTRLPAARGVARVVAREPGSGPIDHAVELVCDTLAIDGDRQTLTMVWRGRHSVAGGEAALSSMAVLAALESPGAEIEWPRSAPQPRAQPTQVLAVHAEEAAGEGTMTLLPEVAESLAARRAVPFADAPKSTPSPSTDATPWGRVPIVEAPIAAPGEATWVLSRREAPGEATFALRADQQAAAARQPIMPYPVHAVTPPASAPRVAAGLPWSEAGARAPIPIGEETMALGMPVASVPVASVPVESVPVASVPVAAENALFARLRAVAANSDDVAALLEALAPPSEPKAKGG